MNPISLAGQVTWRQMGVGVACELRRRVAEDPLQREDVAAAHYEMARKDVAEIVNAETREPGAGEGVTKYLLQLWRCERSSRRWRWGSTARPSRDRLGGRP